LKAASVEVEPYWPGLFAKALEGIDVKSLITNIGSGGELKIFHWIFFWVGKMIQLDVY
jgi:hypothetical protein